MVSYQGKLDQAIVEGKLTPKLALILKNFYQSYRYAFESGSSDLKQCEALFDSFLKLIFKQLESPYNFESFHKRITKPFDYHRFGLDFIRPLILLEKSNVIGTERLDQMEGQLAAHENIILLANHQTEPDPQVINILLEKKHPRLAEEMIFVAGHRVISDPLAVPFSMGCNLLCIYSKKHIEYPPEQKQVKLLHNQRTMKHLISLLQKGVKCIYVAPSGGRDRPNADGVVEVASFDPSSIEMFYLMASQAERKTHFYPLALATHDLLPPPLCVEKELGEVRQAKRSAVHLSFGPEIDMENFPGSFQADKRTKRKMRADYIWNEVSKDYKSLTNVTE